jgi:hypothetical protein
MNHLSKQINVSSNDWYTLSGHFDEIVSSGQFRAAPKTAVAPEPTALTHNDWRTLSGHFDEAIGTPKPIAFTNYDVLFASTFSSSPDDGDTVPKYTLINHVGNRRFLVFLNIYRQRYFDADEQGDEAECKRIVLEIIKTVRLQCVPQGRFLQQDAKNRWHEMNELDSLVSIVEGEITKNICSSKHGERSEASQLVSRHYKKQYLVKAERQNYVLMHQLPMKVTHNSMAA